MRLRNVPADTQPRDFKMGMKLRRVRKPEGEEPGVPPVVEGECRPHFEGWIYTTDPALVDEDAAMAGYTISVESHEDNDTCGGCLEWSAQLVYFFEIEGEDPPSITSIEGHDDCLGATFTVAPQTTPAAYVFLLHATLNGEPYGLPFVHVFDPIELPVPLCWELGGDYTQVVPGNFTYPAGQDWAISFVYIGPLDGGSTFAFNPVWLNPPDDGATTFTEDVDGLNRPRLTVAHVNTGGLYPEEQTNPVILTCTPTIDGETFECEEGWTDFVVQNPT